MRILSAIAWRLARDGQLVRMADGRLARIIAEYRDRDTEGVMCVVQPGSDDEAGRRPVWAHMTTLAAIP